MFQLPYLAEITMRAIDFENLRDEFSKQRPEAEQAPCANEDELEAYLYSLSQEGMIDSSNIILKNSESTNLTFITYHIKSVFSIHCGRKHTRVLFPSIPVIKINLLPTLSMVQLTCTANSAASLRQGLVW